MRIAAAVLAAALLAAPAGAQAYCRGIDWGWPESRPDYYSIPQQYWRASHIVIARVSGVRFVDSRGRPIPALGQGEYEARVFTVDVLAALKGPRRRRLEIFSQNTSFRFDMTVGETYLLFVESEPDYGRRWALYVDNCSASDVAAKTLPIQRRVRAIAARRTH